MVIKDIYYIWDTSSLMLQGAGFIDEARRYKGLANFHSIVPKCVENEVAEHIRRRDYELADKAKRARGLITRIVDSDEYFQIKNEDEIEPYDSKDPLGAVSLTDKKIIGIALDICRNNPEAILRIDTGDSGIKYDVVNLKKKDHSLKDKLFTSSFEELRFYYLVKKSMWLRIHKSPVSAVKWIGGCALKIFIELNRTSSRKRRR